MGTTYSDYHAWRRIVINHDNAVLGDTGHFIFGPHGRPTDAGLRSPDPAGVGDVDATSDADTLRNDSSAAGLQRRANTGGDVLLVPAGANGGGGDAGADLPDATGDT